MLLIVVYNIHICIQTIIYLFTHWIKINNHKVGPALVEFVSRHWRAWEQKFEIFNGRDSKPKWKRR